MKHECHFEIMGVKLFKNSFWTNLRILNKIGNGPFFTPRFLGGGDILNPLISVKIRYWSLSWIKCFSPELAWNLSSNYSDMVKNQFNVNILGCWKMSQVFMPHLMSSKGRLVNMLSFCTECPLPTLSVYTATKAALFSLSNGMRMELKK